MNFIPEFSSLLRLVFVGFGVIAIVNGLVPIIREFVAWLEKFTDRK